MKLSVSPVKVQLFLTVVIALFLVSAASASPIYNPGNGHYYDAVYTSGRDWHQARSDAESQTFMGRYGHLATITSQSEQDFIFVNYTVLLDQHLWLGGFQPDGSIEPDGGWSWITSEAFTFSNWGGLEPNDAGNENVLEFRSDGSWNDINNLNVMFNGGYLVEFDEFGAPVPIPSGLFLLGSGVIAVAGLNRKRSIK